jgi:hypothetical protein
MLDLSTLNWLAVIVAGLAYFFLGALWYSPLLFAKPFIKYRGEITDGGQPIDYLLTLVCDLAAALVLAIFVRLAGAETLGHGIAVGLAAAAGFAISNTFVFSIFNGVRKELWLIESGYVLVAYAVMGALLALWR